MTVPIPPYCMRAYALLYSRHGTKDSFTQSDLDWLISESMRKKTFAHLLRSGWIVKDGAARYRCRDPAESVIGLLDMRVPQVLEDSGMDYALTGMSSMEVWSDYSYIQRGYEMSPYFVKVMKRDLLKWREHLNKANVPSYLRSGRTIGEYVILMPVARIDRVRRSNLWVEPLKITLGWAKRCEVNSPAVEYIESRKWT